ASWTPCDRSSTSSLVGHRVDRMRLRRSSILARSMATVKGRMSGGTVAPPVEVMVDIACPPLAGCVALGFPRGTSNHYFATPRRIQQGRGGSADGYAFGMIGRLIAAY